MAKKEYGGLVFLRDLAALYWKLHRIHSGSFYAGIAPPKTDEERSKQVDYLDVDASRMVEVWNFARTHTSLLNTGTHPITQLAQYLINQPDGHQNLRVLAASLENGRPTFEVGHALASAMMLSKVPEEVVRTMQFPFKAFEIKIPQGIFGDSEYAIERIVYAGLLGFDGVPLHCVCGFTKDGGSFIHRHVDPARLLGAPETAFETPYEYKLDLDKLDALSLTQERIFDLSKRLIVGVCLYMEEGNESENTVQLIGKGHKSTRKGDEPPEERIFRLTQPIRHNFCKEVRDYVAGNGKKINVQFMVAGHWKNQACGPQGKQRKRIFIQPYWKGPEDAKLALRVHKLS